MASIEEYSGKRYKLEKKDYTMKECPDGENVCFLTMQTPYTYWADYKYHCFEGKGERLSQKVFLILGEQGAGKTTFINSFAHYLYGGDFKDDRLKVNMDQSTKGITAYELPLDRTKDCEHFVFVDCPGFGDSAANNRNICRMIDDFFEKNELISKYDIDAFVIVAKTASTRLTPRQIEIYQKICSLYMDYACQHKVLFATYADAQNPPAFQAILDILDIQPNLFFKCNNTPRNIDANYVDLAKANYERTSEAFNKFIKSVTSGNFVFSQLHDETLLILRSPSPYDYEIQPHQLQLPQQPTNCYCKKTYVFFLMMIICLLTIAVTVLMTLLFQPNEPAENMTTSMPETFYNVTFDTT